MFTPRVCVVGSSNLDLNAYVERFPEPGETLTGLRFATGFGGKGANQAVMAARVGAQVHFIGRVGSDLFGRDMLDNFRLEGIDCTGVRIAEGASSGVAMITIDAAGRNQIVVIPGANGHVSADDVIAARTSIELAQILVLQMEVPLEANLAAIRVAKQAGVRVIFNPAPAPLELPQEFYESAAFLCLNETEAEVLTGGSSPQAAARVLLDRGAMHIVLTLGAEGCLLASNEKVTSVPAPSVKAVDTTGAGDAFIGSLAVDLAHGSDLKTAAEHACRVAAHSVQFPGTQTSFPRAEQVLFRD